MFKNLVFFSLFFFGVLNSAVSQIESEDIIGNWITNGPDPAKIYIGKSNNLFFGKITWLQFPKDDNGIKLDKNNPISSKRSNEIVGLTILRDFIYKKGSWVDGTIYDPENGKTYKCKLKLKDKNTLEVRGYIGISLLGRTEVWTRSN